MPLWNVHLQQRSPLATTLFVVFQLEEFGGTRVFHDTWYFSLFAFDCVRSCHLCMWSRTREMAWEARSHRLVVFTNTFCFFFFCSHERRKLTHNASHAAKFDDELTVLSGYALSAKHVRQNIVSIAKGERDRQQRYGRMARKTL